MNKVVYEGFHTIEEVQTTIKGVEVTREKLLIKDAVACILVDDKNRIGLVSQYRPTLGKQTWEIPAGLMDKDLTPVQTLLGELEEECNITIKDITYLDTEPVHEYYMISGSSDSKMKIYVVEVKNQENRKVDDSEVDEIRWFTVKEVAGMIKKGEIEDAKTIIGYYKWSIDTLHKILITT